MTALLVLGLPSFEQASSFICGHRGWLLLNIGWIVLYLDEIFSIDNPEFVKHIPDIYPTEPQLNKANTSDKDTSFLDLDIKVIQNENYTCIYESRDDFGFSMINSPWLCGDIPRRPSYGIYILQLVLFVIIYKLRRVKDTANVISSCSKIVKRLQRHQYDPGIIKRTIVLVLGQLRPVQIFRESLNSD